MDLICFDLDETLIHARKCHFHAYNDAFKNHGLKEVKYKDLEKLLTGKRAHEIIKILFPNLNAKEVDKLAKEHHKFIEKKYGKCAKAITGAVNALMALKKRFKLALVSNCTKKEIYSLLNGAKIDKKLFAIIVGQDNVKRSKPAPDEILKAERLAKTKAKYHIGDSPYDVIAGRNANVKVISVLTGVNSRAVLKKENPYKIIKSVADLPDVI